MQWRPLIQLHLCCLLFQRFNTRDDREEILSRPHDEIKLKQNYKTVSKLFWNCFNTVSFHCVGGITSVSLWWAATYFQVCPRRRQQKFDPSICQPAWLNIYMLLQVWPFWNQAILKVKLSLKARRFFNSSEDTSSSISKSSSCGSPIFGVDLPNLQSFLEKKNTQKNENKNKNRNKNNGHNTATSGPDNACGWLRCPVGYVWVEMCLGVWEFRFLLFVRES